jgi:hypothetical protein
MTITFHANGRMELEFSEVERPRPPPGQKEHPDLKKAYAHGQLAVFRTFRSNIMYEVPTSDSVLLVRRVFGQRQVEANAFRFVGPDTLIWTQAILNQSQGETTMLVRVRNR